MSKITKYQPTQSSEINAALKRAERGRYYHWTRSRMVHVDGRIYEVALNIFDRIYLCILSLLGVVYLSSLFAGRAVERLNWANEPIDEATDSSDAGKTTGLAIQLFDTRHEPVLETKPFLGELPTEVALLTIQNFSGYDLLRLRRVDHRAHNLVVCLFQSAGYWRRLGFEMGKEPNEVQIGQAFSLVKRTAPRPTLLRLPHSTSPIHWLIIKRLHLVLNDMDSNPQAVAQRAAHLGDVNLCREALKSASRHDIGKCMDQAILGGHPHVVDMIFHLGAPASSSRFHYSIRIGQIAIAERFAAHNPRLLTEITDEEAQNALYQAAERGDRDSITHLANLGYPIDIADRNGQTALHKAAQTGCTTAITTLAELGCPIYAKDKYGETTLHQTSRRGHAEAIRVLGEHGYTINPIENTVLHKTVLYGHTDTIEALLELGCSIDATDKRGRTALHIAAWFGNSDAIRKLVELGCAIETTNEQGSTALHCAAISGKTDATKVLADSGCSIGATDKRGRTALHIATIYGLTNVIEELVSRGCPIDATDIVGQTALHYAAIRCKTDVIKVLAKLGCSINAADKRGRTALHNASRSIIISRCQIHTIKTLADLGCSINATDKEGQTALHYVALKGRANVIKVLASLGCSILATTKSGETALDYAEKKVAHLPS